MDTLQKAVLIAHTLIAVLIIVLVLMQRGKGADAGAAFGAGASGTVFGARGSSSFFSRMTAIFATAFFASSLGLAYLSSQSSEVPESLLEGAPVTEQEAVPTDDEEDLPSADGLPAVEEASDSADDATDGLPAVENEIPEAPEDGEE